LTYSRFVAPSKVIAKCVHWFIGMAEGAATRFEPCEKNCGTPDVTPRYHVSSVFVEDPRVMTELNPLATVGNTHASAVICAGFNAGASGI